MKLTFKAFMMGEWTLTDDRIIVGKKEILLSDIKKVNASPCKSKITNGTVQVFTDLNSTFGFTTLAYPYKQKEDGEIATKYIIDYVEKNQK